MHIFERSSTRVANSLAKSHPVVTQAGLRTIVLTICIASITTHVLVRGLKFNDADTAIPQCLITSFAKSDFQHVH